MNDIFAVSGYLENKYFLISVENIILEDAV
jgi:hypothetical protein